MKKKKTIYEPRINMAMIPEEISQASYKVSEMNNRIIIYAIYVFQQSMRENPEQDRNMLLEFDVREFCIDYHTRYSTSMRKSIEKAINELSSFTFTLTDMNSMKTRYQGDVPFFDVLRIQSDGKVSFKLSSYLIEMSDYTNPCSRITRKALFF